MFRGIRYQQPANKEPKRQIIGVAGVRITIPGLTPVQVTDSRGMGLNSVQLTAQNPTSGSPFIVNTDSNGNALLQLDANTTIEAKKNNTITVINHASEAQHVINVDLMSIE